jgi:hypothetical protein
VPRSRGSTRYRGNPLLEVLLSFMISKFAFSNSMSNSMSVCRSRVETWARELSNVNFESVKSVVETVALVAGSLSLIVASVAYVLSRKSLQFTVMIACIERFQELLPNLDIDTADQRDVLRYLDLCNEELFYFKRKYLRKDVALEWIEGMVRFLPLLNEATKLPWPSQTYLSGSKELIYRFPRVEFVFSTPAEPDVATDEARRRYVERIFDRAQRYPY